MKILKIDGKKLKYVQITLKKIENLVLYAKNDIDNCLKTLLMQKLGQMLRILRKCEAGDEDLRRKCKNLLKCLRKLH